MHRFADLKLRSKLLAAFGLVLVLFAGTGLFAVRQLAVVNDQSTVIAATGCRASRRAAL
jgi:hypothetical protein